MRLKTLIRTACLLCLALGNECPAEAPGELILPAQTLEQALQTLAKARGVQIIFDPTELGQQRTSDLSGPLTTDEALQRLLKGTNLIYCYLPSGTVEVTLPQDDIVCARSSPTLATQTDTAANPNRQNRRKGLADARRNLGPPAPAPESPASLDIVRVYGSPLGFQVLGGELVNIPRIDFDSGAIAAAADFSRTVPSVFGGGPAQGTRIGVEAQSNAAFGTGINVRGLGARATLVLINGVRLAPGGTQGSYVDIENIPLSAVDHVDILPDSAAPTHGADAVGGVVNFVMRDDFTGAETAARAGTTGDLREFTISQVYGARWDAGHAMFAAELGGRGAQAAASRSYAVSDLRPFGGEDFDTNLSNPGNIVSGNESYAIPPGQNGTHLTPADLRPGSANLQNRYLDTDILPSQKRWGVYASGREDLGSRSSAWLDVLISRRDAAERQPGVGASFVVPATNPYYVNPAGGTAPVVVDYNFVQDLGPTATHSSVNTLNATLGLDLGLGSSWSIKTYLNYAVERERTTNENQVNFNRLDLALSDPNPLSAFNPFGQGSNTSPDVLGAIRSNELRRQTSTLNVVDVLAKGPILTLPAGAVRMIAGLDLRAQMFDSLTPDVLGTSSERLTLRSHTRALFAEVLVPLLGGDVTWPLARALEASAALRKEDNSIYGSTLAPRLGARWLPAESLSIRATWSRTIRPPALEELSNRDNTTTAVTLPDTGGSSVPTLLVSGNSSQLHSEHARSWTTGLDFAPGYLPELSLSLTYFNVAYTDRIQSTTFSSNFLTDPQYATLVIRQPDPAMIDSLCATNRFYQGNSLTCMSYPAGAIVDLRERNISRLLTRGLDLAARFERPTELGTARFSILGTKILKFAQADAPTDALTSLLSTQNNPIDLRLRTEAAWQRGRWQMLVATNFTDNYRNTEVQPNQIVASWITVDALASYTLERNSDSLFKTLHFNLAVQNLLDRNPPFLDNQVMGIGFDQENANSLGRFIRAGVRVSW